MYTVLFRVLRFRDWLMMQLLGSLVLESDYVVKQ